MKQFLKKCVSFVEIRYDENFTIQHISVSPPILDNAISPFHYSYLRTKYRKDLQRSTHCVCLVSETPPCYYRPVGASRLSKIVH